MEKLDFCISTGEENFSPITVDGIYYVFADNEYHICHHPIIDGFVLVATLSGRGILQLHEEKFVLSAGDVFLFDATDPFTYWCDDASWNFWWFEFHCNIESFIELPIKNVFNFPFDSHLLHLCNESLNNMKLKDVKTASYMLSVLICLLSKKNYTGLASRRGYTLFREADQYIRNNLDSATVASTAEALSISERTLRNLFQSLLGMRPVEYIQNIRMDMARHLLSISDISIKDIAANLGYADQFVFSKSFQKHLKMSPTDYRQKQRVIKE